MNTNSADMESLKTRLKAMWMAGDFGQVAEHITRGAEEFVGRLAIVPGVALLDVACGTGNVAIPAARLGATVTGVDIATNLLEQARARTQQEGLMIQFDEGDAENLPYPDGAFQIVTSMFGAMFAPRPELVAAELKRVCQPGGKIAMANWTPNSVPGQMFKISNKYMPPPANVLPPVQWGEVTTICKRLQDGIANLTFARRLCPMIYPCSPAEVVEFHRIYFGPTKRLFEAIDANMQEALRKDLEQLWTEHNRATDNTTYVEGEYLEVIAIRN